MLSVFCRITWLVYLQLKTVNGYGSLKWEADIAIELKSLLFSNKNQVFHHQGLSTYPGNLKCISKWFKKYLECMNAWYEHFITNSQWLKYTNTTNSHWFTSKWIPWPQKQSGLFSWFKNQKILSSIGWYV